MVLRDMNRLSGSLADVGWASLFLLDLALFCMVYDCADTAIK